MTATPLKPALLEGLCPTFASASQAPPAAARTQEGAGINIGMAPPSPRFEPTPTARRGCFLAAGYWRWHGRDWRLQPACRGH